MRLQRIERARRDFADRRFDTSNARKNNHRAITAADVARHNAPPSPA
jgi:hypothetical protein